MASPPAHQASILAQTADNKNRRKSCGKMDITYPAAPWPERALRDQRDLERKGNGMKISARNSLEGTVKEVIKGATTAHVELELKGGDIVTASITNEAVDDLGLVKGKKAYAVIKSSDVMIATH
jgi:molybdopterin-binding protein